MLKGLLTFGLTRRPIVLLILMIMTIPMSNHSVDIDLPVPSNVPAPPVETVKNKIVLTPEGAILWNGTPITDNQLVGNLQATRTMAVDVEYWPTFDASLMMGQGSRDQILQSYRDVRDRLLRRVYRSASSSFFSRERTGAGGVVALEFYAVRPREPASRRRSVACWEAMPRRRSRSMGLSVMYRIGPSGRAGVQQGFEQPAESFLHLAAETGLLFRIEEWVLGEACRQAAFWRDAGGPTLTATGAMLGTPGYMPPEQLAGSDVTVVSYGPTMPVLLAASCMFALKLSLIALELNAAIRCGLVAAVSLVVMYVYFYVVAPAAARVE